MSAGRAVDAPREAAGPLRGRPGDLPGLGSARSNGRAPHAPKSAEPKEAIPELLPTPRRKVLPVLALLFSRTPGECSETGKSARRGVTCRNFPTPSLGRRSPPA